MPERSRCIADFLTAAGWSEAETRPLAGDASFRRYHRVSRNGVRAILMDAPPDREDVRPFVRMARHLLGLGLSAPGILASDESAGLLLLLASLACTPLNTLFGWRQALQVRRTLGLYGFGYVVLHLLSYAALDNMLDYELIWRDVGERRSMIASFWSGR